MKPRLVWLGVVLLALIGRPIAAQTRVITGTVTDSATGGPITGAAITIPGTRLGAYTKDNGSFLIANAPEGDVALLIRFIG